MEIKEQGLQRGLSFFDAACIVVGTIIGTGVFLKTSTMLQQVGTPGLVIGAWVVAGVLSLMGALAYAELGGMFPAAGGEYVYLRRAYGDMPAFLYGWTRFWIASPATIAAYSVGAVTFLFGGFMSSVSPATRMTVIFGFILFFSFLNCLTVALSGKIQSVLTILKTAMILGLGFGVFLFAEAGSFGHISGSVEGVSGGASAFGIAMIAALWAYDGWNNLPMVAGEVKNPQRNVPLALAIGTFIILTIYLLLNVAYFYALPVGEVISANSGTNPDALPVATKAAQTFLGPASVKLLSLAVVISALGAMNGSILTGARVPYAMAHDGLFFKKLGVLSQRTRVPIWSILIQAVWSCILAASGSFDLLTDYVVFSSWIFYGACVFAVIILRRRMPSAARPFRAPGYPWIPAGFVVASGLLLANTIYTMPKETGMGLLIIGAGIPVYYWFRSSAVAMSPVIGSAD